MGERRKGTSAIQRSSNSLSLFPFLPQQKLKVRQKEREGREREMYPKVKMKMKMKGLDFA